MAGWRSRLLFQGGRLMLLRHVLSSMPIHLLSVLHVPKVVIQKVNYLCASFFWGSQDRSIKRKLRAWKKLCAPHVEEGGIGVRDISEVQRSLFMKFGWLLETQNFLWAKFFRAKYIKAGHAVLSLNCRSGSWFWKEVLVCLPEILANSRWKAREGGISFWYDKFFESGPLCEAGYTVVDEQIKLKDLIVQNEWDVERIQQLVGSQKTMEVVGTVGVLRDERDVLLWLPEKNGLFTSSSACEIVRSKMPNFEWASWVWHKWLPKKISLCMWKAVFNCLSVDEKVEASLLSPYGRRFQQKLECILMFNRVGRNVSNHGLTGVSEHHNWEASWGAVWLEWRVGLKLSWTCGDWCWHWMRILAVDAQLLRRLEISVVEPRKKEVQVLRWSRPRLGRWKLNLDGSYFRNPGPAGGGGILRDVGGSFIFGFSKFFGTCSNKEAELRAVVEGIKICKQMGYNHIDIECDSVVVVDWITSRKCSVWYLWDFWEQLRSMLEGLNFSIKHFYREGNQVAYALARCGAMGENKLFSDCFQLPRDIRGLYRLDKMGVAYFRRKVLK
ncbi:hypothetical protein I3842_16G088800 [Carya illinoinensis]|uniref:RNase H type-1 domain-containing protein n=1 Tax=Carya illinoinensis TaxID=32201 RepID=A0A922A336_CARIL|nr:hypothetical protein I3842_16G088800 [Carya illinoinensis]